ncbi:protein DETOXIFICATION 3-like [Humulus lupulus]|uniref:protein DETOXIFICATION 3-like n=1 Tax=Humulus lupulus TaxID=3486 RepID=UPI002B4141EA|nr:protein DETOXIFICATION 3-like [Humulus lupulus]
MPDSWVYGVAGSWVRQCLRWWVYGVARLVGLRRSCTRVLQYFSSLMQILHPKIRYNLGQNKYVVAFFFIAFSCLLDYTNGVLSSKGVNYEVQALMDIKNLFNQYQGCLPRPSSKSFSIFLTISTLHFTISYGVGVATSTRVSNELGAGKPEAARLAVWATMFIATTEAAIESTILFLCRSFVGYAYSNEKQLVNYIAFMTPLICLSVCSHALFDSSFCFLVDFLAFQELVTACCHLGLPCPWG